MVLRYGDLVEEGNARELLRDPKQEYTKRLLEVRSLREQKEGETGQNLILEVTSVTARYPQADEEVLKDVSIKVPQGKTVAVVGESGSGKSTLARVITGLLPARQGSVIFQGSRLPPVLRNSF